MNIKSIGSIVHPLAAFVAVVLFLSACSSPMATVPSVALAQRAAQPEPAQPEPAGTPNEDNDLTQDAPFTGLEYKAAPEPVRPDIPLVVNRPSPSEVDPAFLGPVQLMRAAVINEAEGTATMPLYEGRMASGESVWYIITDTSDEGLAELLGVNHSRKLIYTDIERGVRDAVIDGTGTVVFEQGRVDFTPELVITPGEAPNFFPPAEARPGSVGDEFYTPLFQLQNGGGAVIYNGPVLAFGASADQLNAMCEGNPDYSIVHDKVTAICPRDGTVTLKLTLGYSFAKPVWYASFDANTELAATLEGSTLTPVYDALGIQLEDATLGSGLERILLVLNGPTGGDNPDRQGLNSALADGRDPINVFGGIPTYNLDYSPLWDAMLLQWTPEAIEAGYDTRLIDAFQALQYETRGYITGPEGGRVTSSGIVINCPIFLRFN